MSIWTRCIIAHCKRFNSVVGTLPNIYTVNCSSMVASNVTEPVTSDICTVKNFLHSPGDLKKFLFERFSQEKNCYTYTIDLISTNYLKNKTISLHSSFHVLQMFQEWLQANEAAETLTHELKMKAINVALRKQNHKLIRIVCDIYQMKEQMEDIKIMIDKCISEGNIEYAANCVIALNLQDKYPFEKIAIPLLMSFKFSICKRYFEGHDLRLKEFITFIDNLLGSMTETNTTCVIGGVRVNRKTIFKYISVLLSHQVISENLCPNAMRIKAIGALKMLIRRREEKTMTENAWDEMVESVVQNDVELQKKLVERLIFKKDHKTAMRIAEKFNLPFDASSVPDSTDEEEQQLNEENTDDSNLENGNISDPMKYLSLELDPSKVKFITTELEFLQCITHISQPGSIVGIDSEWKPNFSRGSVRLSLVQLALKDQVYILDILALRRCLQREHWDHFMTEFFGNSEVIKLGCGITQDIQMFLDDNLGSKNKPVRFSHILDVSILFQKMENLYPDFMEDNSNTKGLSKLSEIILGKPLNKKGRFCNWEQRPLSNQQITYAALDAYCLLQMFDLMKSKAIAERKNFEDLVLSAIFTTVSMSKTATKINKDLKWSRTENAISYQLNQGINDFKVVVDSRLSKLGLKLRMYGVDVAIQDIPDICKDSFKVVNEESRIVIGSSSMSEKVKGLLPPQKYYIVENNEGDQKNNVALIFKHFSIQMSPLSIFSRCMECNSNEFHVVPSDSLQRLYETHLNKGIDKNSEPELPSNSQSSLSGLNIEVQFDKVKASDFSLAKTFKVCTKCGNVQFQR